MSNLTVQQQQNLESVNLALKSPDIYSKIQEMLGRKPDAYITSVMQVLSSNTMLAGVSADSITGAVFTACAMNLPLNNNLGLAYIVPFKGAAQLQVGYKGYLQLAQRTGQIESINAIAVYDTDTEESVLSRLTSLIPRKVTGNVIGYTARLKTITGFVAVVTMTSDELWEHAYKYSQTYKSAQNQGKTYSVWHQNFDAMAKKTVIKALMKYCPMSVELQQAVESDQGVIGQDGAISYPDNEMKDVAQEPRVISDEKFVDMENAVKSGKLKKQDALNEKVYALTEFQYETIQAIEVLNVQ